MSPAKRNLPTLLPKPPRQSDDQHVQAGPSLGLVSTEPPRKRQVVSNACNNCRKRKSKCDNTRPRCARCVQAGLHCEFSAPEGISSRQAEKEQNAKYRQVVELLHKGSPTQSAQILQKIRAADNVVNAVSSIADAQLLLSAASSSAVSTFRPVAAGSLPPLRPFGRGSLPLTSPYDDSDFMFEKRYMVDARDRYVDDNMFVDVSRRSLPLSRWTTASSDDRLMNDLVTLFFTWDNIVERTLYRPLFEEDVVGIDPSSADQHQGSFCSRFLVNALLALSCLYTMDPTTFKDSEDSRTRGRRWADEAEELLEKIDSPSLPLLQGLLAMFCYEGNLGSGTKAVPYLLRCRDVYNALNTLDAQQHRECADEARLQRERHATSWCMWGFYCCEWRGSEALCLGKMARKPKAGKTWREPDFPLSRPDSVGYWWFPYPMSLHTQRSMQVEVREADSMLSELAEEALDFIYPEQGKHPPVADPGRALELYDALVRWKLSCPNRIRFEEAVLPSTILLHISLEVIITVILRPFSHMTKEQFSRFDPRERCYTHAASLMSAVWTFRAFAHVQFEYWLNHAVGTAAYIALRQAEDVPTQMDTLIRACHCLHEMRVSLPLATDVLSGIRIAFRRCKLQVPEYMRKYFDTIRHRKDGLMHHAKTSLLPSATEGSRIENQVEVQLQELLDEYENMGID